jgi:hypothetical protein
MVEATRETARDSLALFRVKIMMTAKAVSGKKTVRRQPKRTGSQPMINL